MVKIVCIYPQGIFWAHIKVDHNHVSNSKSFSGMGTGLNKRVSTFFSAIHNPNIPDLGNAKQDFPLTES